MWLHSNHWQSKFFNRRRKNKVKFNPFDWILLPTQTKKMNKHQLWIYSFVLCKDLRFILCSCHQILYDSQNGCFPGHRELTKNHLELIESYNSYHWFVYTRHFITFVVYGTKQVSMSCICCFFARPAFRQAVGALALALRGFSLSLAGPFDKNKKTMLGTVSRDLYDGRCWSSRSKLVLVRFSVETAL